MNYVNNAKHEDQRITPSTPLLYSGSFSSSIPMKPSSAATSLIHFLTLPYSSRLTPLIGASATYTKTAISAVVDLPNVSHFSLPSCKSRISSDLYPRIFASRLCSILAVLRPLYGPLKLRIARAVKTPCCTQNAAIGIT